MTKAILMIQSNTLSTISGRLSDLLKSNLEINYPVDPTNEDIEKIIKQTDNSNVVIFVSYNSTQYPNQEKLFNLLRGKKVFVAVGEYNPQNINADCIIELNSAKTPSLIALADILQQK